MVVFVPLGSHEEDEHRYESPDELKLEMEEAELKDVSVYQFCFFGASGVRRDYLRGIGRK